MIFEIIHVAATIVLFLLATYLFMPQSVKFSSLAFLFMEVLHSVKNPCLSLWIDLPYM